VFVGVLDRPLTLGFGSLDLDLTVGVGVKCFKEWRVDSKGGIACIASGSALMKFPGADWSYAILDEEGLNG
jgi:hypothetical protein